PGMDGYELARRLRALFGPQILLIALTGYGMEADARKAREAGFDQHLTKPVDLDKLAQVMEAAGRSPQAIGPDHPVMFEPIVEQRRTRELPVRRAASASALGWAKVPESAESGRADPAPGSAEWARG